MRLFIRVLIVLWFSGNLLGAFAQETTTRTGFAVVTVVSGNVAGLIATETLRNNATGEQATVAPSPLVTTGSMLVRVGPVEKDATAIAIANPSAGSGGVNLVLTDTAGRIILNTVVRLGPHGQLSRYLNEFFSPQTVEFDVPLLLTISAEIPVAIVAFTFQGADFTPIPLTSLSTPTPVPVQSSTPPVTTASPSLGLGVPLITPPVVLPVIPATTFPSGGSISGLQATTSTFGGGSSLVFPFVASGGDWSTEIAIGNTSGGLQGIQIDLFGSDGVRTSSLAGISIQPRAVFVSSQILQAAIR